MGSPFPFWAAFQVAPWKPAAVPAGTTDLRVHAPLGRGVEPELTAAARRLPLYFFGGGGEGHGGKANGTDFHRGRTVPF